MERLTDARLAFPPDVWIEATRETREILSTIPIPTLRELYYRLALIEDILGDEYDLDRLRELAPVKHGYWMDSSNGWTCSECISDNMRDTKWCPNCGAKMDRKVPD